MNKFTSLRKFLNSKIALVSFFLLVLGVTVSVSVYKVKVYAQMALSAREIYNKVWDSANHRLLTTTNAGAQNPFFGTEAEVLNDVYDAQNNLLRVSGSSSSSSSTGVGEQLYLHATMGGM